MTTSLAVPSITAHTDQTHPQQGTAKASAELDQVRSMSPSQKWRARGVIIGYGRNVVPAKIWRALTVRPANAGIREMTQQGDLDEALADAIAWEREHLAALTEAALQRSAATAAARVNVASTAQTAARQAEQEHLERLAAELRGERDPNSHLPASLRQALANGATLPGMTVVTMTAAEITATRTPSAPQPSRPKRSRRGASGRQAATTAVADSQIVEVTTGPTVTESRVDKILRLAAGIDPNQLANPEHGAFVQAVRELTAADLRQRPNGWQRLTIQFLESVA